MKIFGAFMKIIGTVVLVLVTIVGLKFTAVGIGTSLALAKDNAYDESNLTPNDIIYGIKITDALSRYGFGAIDYDTCEVELDEIYDIYG